MVGATTTVVGRAVAGAVIPVAAAVPAVAEVQAVAVPAAVAAVPTAVAAVPSEVAVAIKILLLLPRHLRAVATGKRLRLAGPKGI